MFAKLAKTRTILITVVIAAGLLFITALVTTPDKLGPFGITLWFLGFLVMLAGLTSLLLYRWRIMTHKGADKPEALTRSLRHGVLFSTWLTALVALNSLHQLGPKDIILVTFLIFAIDFYLRRLAPA